MKNLSNQTENSVTVSGKLVSVNLREGITKTGKPYVGGRATVRVNQSYLGITETCQIPVSFFSQKYTSKGGNNPSYENIMGLNKYNTIENSGEANADNVRFTGASLRENSYASKSGAMVDGWQINASFANHAVGEDSATFSFDSMVVLGKSPEIDRVSGEETGRLLIKAAVIQWGQQLDVLNFVIDDPNQAMQVDNSWEINSTVKAWGRIRVTVKEDKRPVSTSSWGEDEPGRTNTYYVRELVLTGGYPIEEDDDCYDKAEIKKGVNQRKALREQKMSDTAAPKASAPKNDYGWM